MYFIMWCTGKTPILGTFALIPDTVIPGCSEAAFLLLESHLSGHIPNQCQGMV